MKSPVSVRPGEEAANLSRQDKWFADWNEHAVSGTAVNEALRNKMIIQEQEMMQTIQQRIYQLLRQRQEEGIVPTSFRTDP